MDYRQLRNKIAPYEDILLFVVCLLAANYFWKYTIVGQEESNSYVGWMGLDITAPFAILAEHIASVVATITSWIRPTIHYRAPYSMYFDSGFAVSIVWGCTALKQSFIWLIIMLFAKGKQVRKLWFIPLGWLCVYLFNILRITLIGLLCEYHPTMFEFWHSYFFKYLFYAMLFMLWVWWVERIGKTKKVAETNKTTGVDKKTAIGVDKKAAEEEATAPEKETAAPEKEE